MPGKNEDQNLEITPEEITDSTNDGNTEEANGQADDTETFAKKYIEINEKYLRLMAEYDNFRKRTTKERSEIYPQATCDAVQRFLPVIDNIGRAKEFDTSTGEFAEGFKMICENFGSVLDSLGVKEIGEIGEQFDPLFHNAVMHIEDESLGKNAVSQVIQKGYKIGDKVIRFATVQTAN